MDQVENLPFPRADRRALTHAPIELIIAQVRFPAVAQLYSNDGYVDFAKLVTDEYPTATPQQHLEISINPAQGVRDQGRTPVWKFESLDGNWTLTLTPSFVALETRQYQSFTEFSERFERCWSSLREVCSPKYRTRVGLRYVDRVTPSKYENLPENWLDLIASESAPLRGRMDHVQQRSELEHRFKLSDSLGLTYRSQLFIADDDCEDETSFTLDLDAFDQQNTEVGEVVPLLHELKEATHNAFWWTLGSLFDKIDP